MTRNTISTVENIFSDGRNTRSGLKPVTRGNALFNDILLDSSVETKRRTWTTLASIVFQLSLIGILVLLPLWFTEVLPTQQLITFLVAPPPPPPPPPPAVSQASVAKAVKVSSNIVEAHLSTPSRIPTKVQMIKEDVGAPPPSLTDGVVGGVPGGTAGGQLGGVLGGIVGSTADLVPKLSKPPEPKPTVQRVRVSQGVTTGLLISRVQPDYPVVAHTARVQGTVILTAIIGKDGRVERLQLESGNPLLVQAAIDAVRQWRYKPFLLNGQPIEIETTVTVNFQLHNG
jgi:protein TonB